MKTKHHPLTIIRSPRRLGVGFCLLLVMSLLFLVACGQQRTFSNENDKLREKNLHLEQDIAQLQDQLALREGELRAMREQDDTRAQPIEGVEPPRLAGIVLGLYSGPIDLDGDAKYDALRVYVRPVDQHSRQITAEGTARVRLIVTPAEGDPQTILDQRYDTKAFHDSYRNGVTGTHYALAADLPAEVPTTATLHVTLTDAATGRSYSAEKQVTLVRTQSVSE